MNQGIENNHLSPMKEELTSVTKDVKDLLDKFNESQQNNYEDDFLASTKGKPITLVLDDGTEKSGLLNDIDKFRITIDIDGKQFHIFKHSITGYFAS